MIKRNKLNKTKILNWSLVLAFVLVTAGYLTYLGATGGLNFWASGESKAVSIRLLENQTTFAAGSTVNVIVGARFDVPFAGVEAVLKWPKGKLTFQKDLFTSQGYAQNGSDPNNIFPCTAGTPSDITSPDATTEQVVVNALCLTNVLTAATDFDLIKVPFIVNDTVNISNVLTGASIISIATDNITIVKNTSGLAVSPSMITINTTGGGGTGTNLVGLTVVQMPANVNDTFEVIISLNASTNYPATTAIIGSLKWELEKLTLQNITQLPNCALWTALVGTTDMSTNLTALAQSGNFELRAVSNPAEVDKTTKKDLVKLTFKANSLPAQIQGLNMKIQKAAGGSTSFTSTNDVTLEITNIAPSTSTSTFSPTITGTVIIPECAGKLEGDIAHYNSKNVVAGAGVDIGFADGGTNAGTCNVNGADLNYLYKELFGNSY